MAKNTKDNELDETQKEEMKKELERVDKEKREEEYRAKLEAQERKTNEANEKLAKLEGAFEAVKSFQQTQANKPVEWTEEQWTAFEEKTGLKKETLNTIDNVFGAKLKDVETKFEARARQAEERARQAEEKYAAFEGKRSFENQTREYLSKKPQFSKYEKEISEFVNDYPEEMRKDPVKLASIFDKAETYIKGKVGEKEMRRTTGGSQRFGTDDSSEAEDGDYSADLSDLRAHERLTVERILPNKEKEQKLKENRHDLKGDSGVMINTRAEFDKYNKR